MFADHDAYIAEAPQELRPLLVRLRGQLARALPDAEEVIAYKMPGFRIGKSIIAGMQRSASNAVSICHLPPSSRVLTILQRLGSRPPRRALPFR
jgi:uncharacterized protein YdhG (YjbR/CyaY superfamily)